MRYLRITYLGSVISCTFSLLLAYEMTLHVFRTLTSMFYILYNPNAVPVMSCVLRWPW